MPYEEKLEEKLEELHEQYKKTPYNKHTNTYLGLLRKKISQAKKAILEAKKRKKGAGFAVKKSGDATVVLVGFPNLDL